MSRYSYEKEQHYFTGKAKKPMPDTYLYKIKDNCKEIIVFISANSAIPREGRTIKVHQKINENVLFKGTKESIDPNLIDFINCMIKKEKIDTVIESGPQGSIRLTRHLNKKATNSECSKINTSKKCPTSSNAKSNNSKNRGNASRAVANHGESGPATESNVEWLANNGSENELNALIRKGNLGIPHQIMPGKNLVHTFNETSFNSNGNQDTAPLNPLLRNPENFVGNMGNFNLNEELPERQPKRQRTSKNSKSSNNKKTNTRKKTRR